MGPARLMLLSVALVAAPLSAKPTTEPAQPPAEADALTQIRATVEAMREEMFRPGPIIPGWNVGGGDPDSEIIAAGAERHYGLLEAEDGDKSVVILTDRRIADFAPSSWRIVDSYGSAVDAVDRPFVQFSRISPRYVIGIRANGFRRDTIDCSDRISHAFLYELPGEALSEEDQSAPLMFRLGLLASEGVTTCTRYEGSRAEGWLARPLLPDGRSLPALSEPAERLRIVPAAPIDELMRR
ncbi:MAG TPA: hypothetical protein VNT25_05235 [Allosphingosinicella sp.]|nr:hypothetical protein [Allosphingosinicella sp.]